MTESGFLQIALYLAIILVLVKPLGWYIAQVYQDKPCGLNYVLRPLEFFIYRICAINPREEMHWRAYLRAMLFFNLFGLLAVYAIQRFQAFLPLNPQHFAAVPPDLAFNTAASFVTNTNWQAYSGENTLSYFTQMMGLAVQNFLSAATGMSLLMVLIRGFVRRETSDLGNFWTDMVRGLLYILLPLAIILSIVLVSQGVIQNIKPYQTINTLETTTHQTVLPMGPVASQVAIKQLGTNGGGFFGTNSAHPFENPNPVSNFFEMLALVLIPAALCYSFGILVNDKRQGWAILIAMLIIFIPATYLAAYAEQQGNPVLTAMGVAGENMEGKEIRIGSVSSALWASAATATSNGSNNAMYGSFLPLGGLIPMWLMQLGEVVFGGIGSGLYGMLMLVVITVFIAGLMVGRTPEYLGKKIEPYEMKMASIAVLVMPLIVLLCTAIASVTHAGISSIGNPGAHGLSEMLYAFTSMTNNNGSTFGGLNANTPFYNIVGGIAILIGRYWVAIPTLALAGSLAQKKKGVVSAGTLPTHTLLFIILLVCVTVILAALTFFPVLSLGPLVEHLMLWGHHGY